METTEATAGAPASAIRLKWSLSAMEAALLVLLLFGLAQATYYLLVGLNNPVFDRFGFRQAQTAITVYWMMQGGPLLEYETPVLGAPWPIPFELPFYQWAVVALAKTGLSIDAAGRIANFGFFLACLGPVYSILKRLGFSRVQYLLFAVLFLTSPFFVFWSRTVMIESAALFLGLAWLALVIAFLQSGGWWRLGLAVLAGILGIATKSTTFSAFGILAAAAIAIHFASSVRGVPIADFRRLLRVSRAHVFVGVACAVVLVAGLLWVDYTDAVKGRNPVGVVLDSEHLKAFNFGRMDLRWSAEFWRDIILNRTLPEFFGPLFVAAIAAMGAALTVRRNAWVAALCLVGALVPLLMVTNLHRVHNYYQYANGIFIVGIAALGCGALMESGRKAMAIALLSVLLASQLWQFHTDFKQDILKDHTANSRYQTGVAVGEIVPPGEAVLIFGNDWNSNILYYAQRKGLAVPNIVPAAELPRIIADPEAYLGGMRLGAVVQCAQNQYGAAGKQVDEFVAARRLIRKVGPCEIREPRPA